MAELLWFVSKDNERELPVRDTLTDRHRHFAPPLHSKWLTASAIIELHSVECLLVRCTEVGHGLLMRGASERSTYNLYIVTKEITSST